MSASGWDGILHGGEEIVWQGQPEGGILFRPSDIPLSLFGLVFMGFAIFWMGQASRVPGNAPGLFQFFWMFGLPFLAVGAYLAVGRYFWEAYMRQHTFYSLSTKRAFIATDVPLIGRGLKDYPISPETRVEMADQGCVYFAEKQVRTKNGYRTVKVGFERLGDPQEAMKALNKVRLAKRTEEAG